MNEIRRAVQQLDVGKRMPAGVYVHTELLRRLPPSLRELADWAREPLTRADRSAFNVLKFHADGQRVGLLSYPDFFDDPFPALAASLTVDLRTGAESLRRYDTSDNPPILHRKELLLPDSHPRCAEYAALTRAAEDYGLFADAHTIGTRRAWEDRLRRARLRLRGHRLVAD